MRSHHLTYSVQRINPALPSTHHLNSDAQSHVATFALFHDAMTFAQQQHEKHPTHTHYVWNEKTNQVVSTLYAD